MSTYSSLVAKRTFSRSEIRHKDHQDENDNFNFLFCNAKIAQKKSPTIELVQPKPKQSKKYSNLKAYESIPLLSNFKRYLSVQVLRENKNNKYDLIIKKHSHRTQERPISQRLYSSSNRFTLNPQNSKKNFPNKRGLSKQKNPRNEHYRMSLEQIQNQNKHFKNSRDKAFNISNQSKFNLFMNKKLANVQNDCLSIEGNKIYRHHFSNQTHFSQFTNISFRKQSEIYPSSSMCSNKPYHSIITIVDGEYDE